MAEFLESRAFVKAAPAFDEAQQCDRLVRLDQLIAARRSVVIALPVNILLSMICAVVAWHAGEPRAALLWGSASLAVNCGRAVLHWRLQARLRDQADSAISSIQIDRQLRQLWLVTLLSGCTWALLPALCALYTSPQSLFFLAVGCGITAGAVSHGAAYARVPIAFITPPILSAAGAMAWVGGFDRYTLALTMLLYLGALVVTARRAEVAFRRASALTQRVRVMNTSLETAHARAQMVAADMRHRADHDQLTGLLNRAGFLRAAAVQLRSESVQACLMLLDLDGFKAINDAFGHQVGDEILVEVAERLCRELPGEMLVGRWGGDEFAVLFSTGTGDVTPGAVADQLIAAVAAPYSAFGTVARVGLSVGIHCARGSAMPEMLSCADVALYAAKAAGRNRHHVFGDDLRVQLDVRRDIERDLPGALADGGVQVWFQPIFGKAGDAICGLEALVRWRHPIHGWISPTDLMITAAKAGFALPLMEVILDRVCDMLASLRDLGLAHVSVAMNVSPREMSQLPVDTLILAALLARQLPASALEVEITEETALDFAHCAGKLAALSRAGIRIAIDDFGIGYSSLSLLRTLNVDRIKIDRCFVSGLADSAGDQVLVKAVLNLGQSLGIGVIAEGVESLDDLRTLRTLGCQVMQGYHLAMPMPKRECLAFIDAGRTVTPAPSVTVVHLLAS